MAMYHNPRFHDQADVARTQAQKDQIAGALAVAAGCRPIAVLCFCRDPIVIFTALCVVIRQTNGEFSAQDQPNQSPAIATVAIPSVFYKQNTNIFLGPGWAIITDHKNRPNFLVSLLDMERR